MKRDYYDEKMKRTREKEKEIGEKTNATMRGIDEKRKETREKENATMRGIGGKEKRTREREREREGREEAHCLSITKGPKQDT